MPPGGAKLATLVLTCVVLFALSATAAAATRYASPTGTGTAPCEAAADPCALDPALAMAEEGDDVLLAPGEYVPTSPPLEIPREVELHGASRSDRSTIRVTDGSPAVLMTAVEPKLADLDVLREGSSSAGAIHVGASATVERVRVTATEGYACSLVGGVVRNSVCFAKEPTYGALFMGPGAGNSAQIFNSTLYNAAGFGAVVGAPAGVSNEIVLVNTVARGGEADVRAFASSGGTATANMIASNYDPAHSEAVGAGTAHVFPVGEGNQSEPPSFLDASTGDFREAAGSPTIDAGLPGAAGIQPYDVIGAARTQGGSPDIGAYEFTPELPVDEGGGDGAGGSATPTSSPPSSSSSHDPAPKLWALRVRPSVILLGRRARPATVSFHLSERAAVFFVVQRGLPGVRRRVNGELRCTRPNRRTRRLLRKEGRRCVRWRRVAVRRSGGGVRLNSFLFRGKIRGRALRPGRYRFLAYAVDTAGQHSQPRFRGFRIRRANGRRR